MARELIVDVDDAPDLRRLAEEVLATNTPRVLRRGGEDIARVTPLPRRRGRKVTTPADDEAFRAAAGGWKNVDVDRFLQDNAASRAQSTRPPVE